MNIGVILHSQSGNTYAVGQKLMDKLVADGHHVTLSRIKTLNDSDKNQKMTQLDCLPETSGYDALIFGGWVQAFGLCPGMTMYLGQLASIEDMKTTCFLTQHFPYPWMGGRNAMSKMTRILSSKGANVVASGIINWSRKGNRDNQIDTLVTNLCRQYV